MIEIDQLTKKLWTYEHDLTLIRNDREREVKDLVTDKAYAV